MKPGKRLATDHELVAPTGFEALAVFRREWSVSASTRRSAALSPPGEN
jgi:hypothetical protein